MQQEDYCRLRRHHDYWEELYLEEKQSINHNIIITLHINNIQTGKKLVWILFTVYCL